MSKRTHLMCATAIYHLMMALGASAATASEQLTCTLTDTVAQPGAQSRPMTIIVDDAANTLKAQEGEQTYTFRDVSISSVSISGHADDISLGIDRSSFGVVFQSYGAGKTAAIEFGRCQPASSKANSP
jgi:hypothetical protein